MLGSIVHAVLGSLAGIAPVPVPVSLPSRILPAADKDPKIIPPAEYSLIWEIIGWALVALVLAYIVFALIASSPKRPAEPMPAMQPTIPLGGAELRAKYLGEIDRVEQAMREWRLGPREVFAELSRIVKQYAAEESGVNLDRMTLEELQETRFKGLAYAINEYYPQIFSPDTDMQPEQGIFAAREVIRLWR